MVIILITILQIAIIFAIVRALKSPEVKNKIKSFFGSNTVKKGKEAISNMKENIKDDYGQIKETFSEKDYEISNISVDTAMDMEDEVYRNYNFNDVNKNKNTTRYGIVEKEPEADYELDESNVIKFNDTSASQRYSDSIYTENYTLDHKEKPDEDLIEVKFDSDEINLK